MDLRDRGQFLNMSGLFEGGLILAAFLLGWLFEIEPVRDLKLSWEAIAWGVAAALPMFALFVLSQRLETGPLERIRQLLNETLAPSLAACRWYDLILLAALAGVAEEVLFRGLLQPWMETWFEREPVSRAAGLVGSNLLFGLAHAITPTYAVLAGMMGLYLGWLLDAGGERNLLAPIITHGLYDYLAFLLVVKSYRRNLIEESPAANDE